MPYQPTPEDEQILREWNDRVDADIAITPAFAKRLASLFSRMLDASDRTILTLAAQTRSDLRPPELVEAVRGILGEFRRAKI